MLNGVTDLIITKADVMDSFEYVNVGEKYLYDNKEMDYFPFEINDSKLQPAYTSHKGWKKDITKAEKMEDLPQEFLDYISFVEKETEVPVSIVSVGPDRKQTILR